MFSEAEIESCLFARWRWGKLLWQACQANSDSVRAWRTWRKDHPLTGSCQAYMPQIWGNLGSLVAPDESSFRSVTHKVWKVNAELLRGGELALGQLKEAGIPAMVLKGACLQIAFGVASHLRSMSDFDLLVPTECAAQALAHLRAQGWLPLESATSTEQMLAHHGCNLVHQADPGLRLDLHWFALMECTWEGADLSLWQRSRPCRWRSLEVNVPAPQDALLICICHAARFGAWVSPWLLDLQAILGDASWQTWELALQEARSRRVLLPFRSACRFLAQHLNWALPLSCLHGEKCGLLERVYFWSLLRAGTWPAGALLLVADFLRSCDGRRSFWQFLRQRWGVHSPGQMWDELNSRYQRLRGRA